jgi:SAM-dependent methyltransferase
MNSTNEFYTKLFTESPSHSTPYPNRDEALRAGKILEFLSSIVQPKTLEEQSMRILDIGCGRGWLTNFANVFGRCDGVDPIESSINLARRYFPNLTFYLGTAAEVLQSSSFNPYDVIITSEVIEHIEEKEGFVNLIRKCLKPEGYVILTTPRGEEYKKWLRLGREGQPIEEWISETDLRSLFERYQFVPIKHDRIYLNLPKMSFLHRLCANQRFHSIVGRPYLIWLHKSLQYLTAIYQVWLFRLSGH